jgi:hypothetical protein
MRAEEEGSQSTGQGWRGEDDVPTFGLFRRAKRAVKRQRRPRKRRKVTWDFAFNIQILSPNSAFRQALASGPGRRATLLFWPIEGGTKRENSTFSNEEAAAEHQTGRQLIGSAETKRRPRQKVELD